jgi:chromosome segregation ATPase
MTTMQRITLGVLLTMTMTMAVQPAIAADKKDKVASEAQRRVAMIKQQLEAEKAELQVSFEKEKSELKGKMEQSEKAGNTLKRRNAELTQELEVLRKEKAELDAVKLSMEAMLAEVQRDLKSNDEQRKELSKSLVLRDQSLASCNEKNARLHDFGLDLVKICENSSLYKAALRSEPFTQIKRVELENILQGYRDKLDEQRVEAVLQ